MKLIIKHLISSVQVIQGTETEEKLNDTKRKQVKTNPEWWHSTRKMTTFLQCLSFPICKIGVELTRHTIVMKTKMS